MEANPFGVDSGVPHARFPVVPRDRLISLLEAGVLTCHLTVVSAPAGYGKTTLLEAWSRTTRHPLVMVTLDHEVSTVEQLFRRIHAAWRGEKIRGRFDVVMSGMLPDTGTMLNSFMVDCQEQKRPPVFILDNYSTHLGAEIDSALTHLLSDSRSQAHFVISCRGDPGLELSRYRVHHDLLEIHANDLKFSRDEIGWYLHEATGVQLDVATIDSITTRSDGWPAGLRLISLALRSTGEAQDLRTDPIQNRFVWDFLKEEILANLTEDERKFVLACSILERMNGSLCASVTGHGQLKCQQTLEMLERDGIFTQPLDYSRDWYRFHDIFREFLVQQTIYETDPDMVSLHRSAATWYLDHDFPSAALHHAVLSEDVETAGKIFDRHAIRALTGGEMNLFQRWMSMLPAAWTARNLRFDLYRSIFLIFIGERDSALHCLQEVESRLPGLVEQERAVIEARVNAVRSLLACVANDLSRALEFGELALLTLPEDDYGTRSGTHHGLADILREHGHWDQARWHYQKILDNTRDRAATLRSVHAFGGLADLELIRGRLTSAEGYWQRALKAIDAPENFGQLPLPTISWVHIRMAELCYERNDLSQAHDHLRKGLDRVELSGDRRTMVAGNIIASRLALAENDLDRAVTCLEQARAVIESADFREFEAGFDRTQIALWLAQDRLHLAKRWLASHDPGRYTGVETGQDATLLNISRVKIQLEHGESLNGMRAGLHDLAQHVERQGRIGITIEALTLLALLHWKRGEEADALVALRSGLELAEAEGYVAVFTELGAPMATLLGAARSRNVMSTYTGKLLDAFHGRGAAGHLPRVLSEPLSPRETEIIALVGAGLTNREIAEVLFISPETVKKHTASIYSKLGARGRVQAVARYRELEFPA